MKMSSIRFVTFLKIYLSSFNQLIINFPHNVRGNYNKKNILKKRCENSLTIMKCILRSV